MTSRVSWTHAGDGRPSDGLVLALISIATEPESAAGLKGGSLACNYLTAETH